MGHGDHHGIGINFKPDDRDAKTVDLLAFFMRKVNLVPQHEKLNLVGWQESFIFLVELEVASARK